MPEYIEREALFKKILSISVQVMGVRGGKTWFYEVLKLYREKVFEYIKEAPTADVVEARHSEWKQVVFDDGAKSCKCCMACGMFVESKYNYKYCPGCGAVFEDDDLAFTHETGCCQYCYKEIKALWIKQ